MPFREKPICIRPPTYVAVDLPARGLDRETLAGGGSALHELHGILPGTLQGDDFAKVPEWCSTFRKPLIFDECKYEGNIPKRWGDISAREMTRRFWLGMASGAYVGHGETYLDAHDILWWSKGGVLHGESPRRIAFLRGIIKSGPAGGTAPVPGAYYPCIARAGEYYLYFLDYHQPALADFELPAGGRFSAEIIDPWTMSVTKADGVFSGKFQLKLPGREMLAVRFRKVA